MSRSTLSLTLLTSLIGAGIGVPMANAQTAQPQPEQAAMIVVTGGGQERPPQDVPPQKGTPAAEAVTPRAPSQPSTYPYPNQADGFGVKLGGYNVSRWAEDWRVMRDPKKRDDILDRLKYLPISGDGTVYATLSGELRLRQDYISHPNLTPVAHRREQLLRVFAGADVHIGPLRLYGELAHGGLAGHNLGNPAPKSKNDLFAQQYFAELSGSIGRVTAGVRYGRQEFTDGPSGLVSVRDDNTLHIELNGARAWVAVARFRADVFDFRPTTMGLGGVGDDKIDRGSRFSGVTVGMVVANEKTRKIFVDPFVWRDRNDSSKWGRSTGRERRRHYGARVWGSVDRVNFDWTVDRQEGDYMGRPIDAWMVQAAQTYVLNPKGVKPKAGIHFDYGSGGGAYGTGTIRNARTVTGGAIPFSYQGALNLINLFQISPNFTLSPTKKLDVTTEYQHSIRVTETDAVYRGAGTAYSGTQLVSGNHVGDAIRLQATWKVTPRVSVVGRYEYFEPGAVLKAVGSTGSHYVAGWVSFRF
ncbi:alginate export family protein [Sphingomonas sp. RS6]